MLSCHKICLFLHRGFISALFGFYIISRIYMSNDQFSYQTNTVQTYFVTNICRLKEVFYQHDADKCQEVAAKVTDIESEQNAKFTLNCPSTDR